MEHKREIRIKMTVREAIKLYPSLLDEPIENMHYPTDNIIPSTAVFQLTGDGSYRSTQLRRFLAGADNLPYQQGVSRHTFPGEVENKSKGG